MGPQAVSHPLSLGGIATTRLPSATRAGQANQARSELVTCSLDINLLPSEFVEERLQLPTSDV
jgi:hypothetical protein